MDAEEKLSGGNSNDVVRVGNTVHREAGPWTPQVQALLRHLRASGILEAPVPLGFDAQDREIVSFIPGQVGNDPLPAELRSDELLVAAARLLRRMHDATRETSQAWRTGWRLAPREPVEVICHGDFAPYNCVYDQGRLVGIIDFDFAHPGPRSWDLAYALYRFAPVTAPSNPDTYGTLADQARRARLFCDAYGLQDRSQVIPAVIARIDAMADYLRQGAARGDARLQASIDAGHLEIYVNDCQYLVDHQDQFSHLLI